MKTVFNPAEAQRFASWLEEESGRVMIDLRDTTRILTDLRGNWNDSKYAEYLQTFDSSTESLARFKEHAEMYVSYLRKKAALVAEFLG